MLVLVHTSAVLLAGVFRACDQLRCTDCDFSVLSFDNVHWATNTDYLFLRNNMPDFERLRSKLKPKKGPSLSLFLYCFCFSSFSSCLQSVVSGPCSTTHTHARTHPFNGPFSGTTRVSWYQKGKTNLDFTEARDSE